MTVYIKYLSWYQIKTIFWEKFSGGQKKIKMTKCLLKLAVFIYFP